MQGSLRAAAMDYFGCFMFGGLAGAALMFALLFFKDPHKQLAHYRRSLASLDEREAAEAQQRALHKAYLQEKVKELEARVSGVKP